MRAAARILTVAGAVLSVLAGHVVWAEAASATNSFCGDVGIAYATNNGKITHIECNDGTAIDIRAD
jgi:hypothetical protein